ncbi:MAG: helix-turn-helix domain-containing protein [Myxococcota bacterium]
MEKVGRILAEAREARGMSLEDVAAITRVSRSTLESIEHGDPSGLPAQVYVRGFVRAYAMAVGVEPHEVLRLLSRAAVEPTPEEEMEVHVSPPKDNPALQEQRFASLLGEAHQERHGLASSHALLLLLAIGMFLAAWMMVGSRTSRDDTSTASPGDTPAIQEQVDAVTNFSR